MAESVLIERALIVMAVCMAIQTVGSLIMWVAAFVTYRRVTAAIERATAALDIELSDMRARLDRVSDGIEQAALTLNRSASAIHDTVADTTHAIKTAASYVATPRAALALGVLRGLQWFRRMRAERAARAAASKPRLVFHNR
jgi:hypothetical protein